MFTLKNKDLKMLDFPEIFDIRQEGIRNPMLYPAELHPRNPLDYFNPGASIKG
jgi:hypothetical protein